MKWIRHFTNASESLKLQKLLGEMGSDGYGKYWLLLELLGQKFDGEDTFIELHFLEISTKVQIKFTKKLETFLQKLSDFSLISYEISGKVYKVYAPILRELQDKHSKYNRKKVVSNDQDATLDKEEDLEEDKDPDSILLSAQDDSAEETSKTKPKVIGPIEQFSTNLLAAEFLKTVSHSAQELWLKSYPDQDWLVSEFVKMLNWIEVNPRKRPRSYAKFAGNWLSTGWDQYRKTIPGKFSKQSHRTKSSVTDQDLVRAKELGII